MLIVIEGLDAAGKNTQTSLLAEKIQSTGLSVASISFPRYSKTFFAEAIAKYLNGHFGTLADVDPHFAALLYAGDRYESRDYLRQLIDAHDVVISDRYIASNIAYQGARVEPSARDEFISWLARLEYQVYLMPRADLTIYLDVSAQRAWKRVLDKPRRGYTEKSADLHEADKDYLARCRQVYQWLAAENYASRWFTIGSAAGEDRRDTIAEIAGEIWNTVAPALPAKR